MRKGPPEDDRQYRSQHRKTGQNQEEVAVTDTTRVVFIQEASRKYRNENVRSVSNQRNQTGGGAGERKRNPTFFQKCIVNSAERVDLTTNGNRINEQQIKTLGTTVNADKKKET